MIDNPPGVTAPEGVRIVPEDGPEIPCEVRFSGWEHDDGGLLAVWEAVAESVPPPGPAQVHIDVLPARTTLRILLPGGGQ